LFISGILFATDLSFPASAIKVDCSLPRNERIKSRAKVDDLGSSQRGICLIFLALATTTFSRVGGIMKQKAKNKANFFRKSAMYICANNIQNNIQKNCNTVT